jgi:hypothetical protein
MLHLEGNMDLEQRVVQLERRCRILAALFTIVLAGVGVVVFAAAGRLSEDSALYEASQKWIRSGQLGTDSTKPLPHLFVRRLVVVDDEGRKRIAAGIRETMGEEVIALEFYNRSGGMNVSLSQIGKSPPALCLYDDNYSLALSTESKGVDFGKRAGKRQAALDAPSSK